MVQFHGFSVVPGIPFSEKKNNYTQNRLNYSVSVFPVRGKDKTVGSHKTAPSFSARLCGVVPSCLAFSKLLN